MARMHRFTAGIVLVLPALLIAGCAGVDGTGTSESINVEADLRAAEQTWRGTPYVPGGTDLAGVDPVSFVRQVYLDLFALELPRTASRLSSTGAEVARDDLTAGDLVVFKLSSGPTHVGIYLGRGEFAHVSIEEGVSIGRMRDAAWRDTFATARRLNLPGQQVKQAAPENPQPAGRRRTGW